LKYPSNPTPYPHPPFPNPPIYKLVTAIGTKLHGSNTPFLSSTLPGFTDAPDPAVSRTLTEYWISLAVSGGDLNALEKAEVPVWPVYGAGKGWWKGKGKVLSVHAGEWEVLEDPDQSARCEFWRDWGSVVRISGFLTMTHTPPLFLFIPHIYQIPSHEPV
jgi:hypothetical protein